MINPKLRRSQGCATITFRDSGQYQWLSKSEGEFAGLCFEHENRIHQIKKSQLSGSFNETNIAAAVALGLYYGISATNIVEAINSYVPSMNRVEWRQTTYNKVLLDAYNANPTSMSLSVESFVNWHPRGILILGDMFELGAAAEQEHEAIVQQVRESSMFDRYLHPSTSELFSNKRLGKVHILEPQQNWPLIGDEKGAPKDAYILLKGSRGIA